MPSWYNRQQDRLQYDEFNQQEREAKQGYAHDRWAYGQGVYNMKENVWNNAAERNDTRGSFNGYAIQRGMAPLDEQLKLAGQNYANSMSSIDRARKKYALYVKMRDTKPKKPPAAPTMPVYAPPANLPDDAARAEYNTWYDQQIYRWKQQVSAWEKEYGVGAK